MLPKTLAGVLGFMILSGYLITGYMNQDSGTKELEQSMITSVQNTDTGMFGLLNFMGAAWNSIILMVNYSLNFIGYSTLLPPQFTIIFSMFAVMFLIAILKFIRGVSEFYDN